MRLDYYNSLLYGAPEVTLDKLQRAQNYLARVVTCSARRSSAKPLLELLHWLPVRQRYIYKLATLTYKVQSTVMPAIFIHCSMLIPRAPPRSLLLRQCEEADRPLDKNGHRQSRFLHRGADRVERSPG